MKIANLRLKVKLAASFGLVLAIMTVGFAFVFVQSQRLSEIERMNAVSTDTIDHVDLLASQLIAAKAAIRKFVLTGAAGDRTSIDASISAATESMEALKAVFETENPEFLPYLADYRSAVDAYLEKGIKLEETLASDPATRPQAVAMVSTGATRSLSAAVDRGFEALRAKTFEWSNGWTEAAKGAMTQTKWTVLVSGFLSLALGTTMCWLVTRAISRPLYGMTGAMRALAQGDHDVIVPARGQTYEIGDMAAAVQVFKDAAIEKVRLETQAVEGRRAAEVDRTRNEMVRAEAAQNMAQVVDGLAVGMNKLASGDLIYRLDHPFAADYESLRENFNAAVAQLQETIKVVSVNTGAIRSGTDQISTASDDLSRRTEQQAASLEETSAALSEITTAVQTTAKGAAHAREVVKIATADAERSGAVVTRTIAAMSGIEKSSRQISNIIGVIDEIAFQTNLLALNAGVEAARAGEAGRGFAVVASEVRALAQRSAEAAKEIKALIIASNTEVTAGVALVDETGKGLTHVIEQIAEIAVIIGHIATSAEQQANGISEVSIAVRQMDQVTQQNAAMVEEATAATHSLASDSEQLAQAVGRFQVGVGSANSVPVKTLRAAPTSRPKVASRGNAVSKAKAASSENGWDEF